MAWRAVLWVGVAGYLLAAPARGEIGGVVTTIPPVQMLTQAVAGDWVPVTQLQLGASPHGGVLKASQVRHLRQADVLIYVSDHLETALKKVLLQRQAATLMLAHVKEINLLPNRVVEHAHNGELGIDPHIWLNPGYAIEMLKAIRQVLVQNYPEHAEAFAGNTMQAIHELEALDQRIQSMFAQVRDQPFMVHHDVTQYLEHRYGLTGLGAIFSDPHRSPSVKAVREARNALKAQQVTCVFSEPAFNQKLLPVVLDGSATRLAHIEPLGHNIGQKGWRGYVALMENIVDAMYQCLSG